jgi:hypothetical protein
MEAAIKIGEEHVRGGKPKENPWRGKTLVNALF